MQEMHGMYERDQLSRIEAWESEIPSHLSRALGFFAAPLAWGARQIIPDTTMQKALEGAFGAAGAFSGSDDLIREAVALGFAATSVNDLRKAPLHIGDTLSKNVANWAKGLAAAEGAVTGMTGFLGLTADIPALIVLAIRTIRRVGFCYGFDTAAETEREFILEVLSAGAANSQEEKVRAIAAAMAIHANLEGRGEALVAQRGIEVVSREGFSAAVRNLAKQLCINLTKRKAAQTIPVIGGAVGAGMNVIFITEVVTAATMLYQKRRLDIPTVETRPVALKPE